MRSLHRSSIVVLVVICTVFYVSAAAGQQYLCDQGSGKFAARTQEGVEVTVGPEREGGLAKRVCDASINWGKDRLVVAANAATVDLDMLGAAGQNPKLMKFAGERVAVSGQVFQRGGSRAIVIEKIAPEAAKK